MTYNPDEFSEKLDVTGHKCPVPVLRVRRVLEDMPSGAILKVMATDPMTQIDFPHFCAENRHILMEMKEEAGIFSFMLKKAGE